MPSDLVFPSYLLSHALSTGHYSFLKRAEAASSTHELDSVCTAEADRLRTKIAKGKMSDAATKDALVLLMAISGSSSSADHLALGLVPALNTATGSKDIRSKTMGYLYLNENITASNEIHLLLFNTILKDLESSHTPSIALALRSIISVPSSDIAPAVENQLVHLVSHKSHDIRRLALASLQALSKVAGAGVLSGLSDRKIWKRLEDSDPGVRLHSVRVLANMEASGLVDTTAVLAALLRALDNITDRAPAEAAQLPLRSLQLAILQAQEAMLGRINKSQKQETDRRYVALLSSLAEDPNSDSLILPLYSIVLKTAELDSPSSSVVPLLPIRRALLSGRPNGHLWALRCLATLPIPVWAGDSEDRALGEEAMEILMGGLDSPDEAIRIQTLEILRQLSPELPSLQLERVIESITSSLPSSTVHEREAAVGRALEIIELLFASSDDEDGTRAAGEAWKALEATRPDEMVLEGGANRLLGWVRQRPPPWRTAFTSSLLALVSESTAALSPTLAVVIAAVACEHAATLQNPTETCSLLGRLLAGTTSVSIQEALLFSLAGVCTRLPAGRPRDPVIDVVARLRSSSGKHLRHRCDAFSLIASTPEGFLPLKSLLEDTSLPSVVQAFEAHARSLAPPKQPARQETRSPSLSRSKDLSASVLRYDAYPSAADVDPSGRPDKKERRARREREREERRKNERAGTIEIGGESEVAVTAGELALLGLEQNELGVEAPPEDVEEDDTDPFKVSPKKATQNLASELFSLDGGSPFLDSRSGQ